MNLFGGLAGGIGSALVGGLLGGGAGDSGPQEVTTVNDLPDWLKPFYTGGEQWAPQGPPPVNQDWVHWNTAMGMGYPMGPPPPPYANDPRYTGENIYSAPFTFMQPMDNMALHPLAQMWGMQGQGGAMPGGVGPNAGGMGPDLSYPSQQNPQNTAAPVAPPVVAPVEPSTGLSELDEYILRQHQRGRDQRWAADPQAGLLGDPSLDPRFLSDLSKGGRAHVADMTGTLEGINDWGRQYQQIARRR